MNAPRAGMFVLTIALLSTGGSHADEPRLNLRLDPFTPPAVELLIDLPAADPTTNDYAQPATPATLPRLRAILHSPATTLVNLDGTLLPIGAEYHGFRIAAVGARDVVLLKDDGTHVVSMDDQERDDARLR